jgi:hypothetical protein
MPWLVRIAGMKETRRTVQVRMVVVIHPAPCRLEPRSSLVTSLLQWGEPRGCTTISTSGDGHRSDQEAQERGNLPSGVALVESFEQD